MHENAEARKFRIPLVFLLRLCLRLHLESIILAVNKRFFARDTKIASDKSAFLYGSLTFIYV